MPDGTIPGAPSFSTTAPTTTTPVSVPGGPDFSGHPQPPDVPCDPTGEDWRGPPGPPGPPGASGSGGTVISIATTGPGITGGPITTAGTLAVQWNAGATDSVGTGLSLSGGVLSSSVTTYTLPVATTTVLGGVKVDGTSVTVTGDGVISAVAAGGASVTVSDTPPPTPIDGALWWDATSGNLFVFYDDGTSTQWVPATSTVAMPSPRNEARLQSQWQNAAVVSDDTVWWWDMPYAGTISTLKYFTGAGSFNVAIKVNGTTVTGLSAVAVSSSTPATATATALNVFAKGDNITAVITGSTGAPTDALLSLAVTWS